MLKEPTQGNVLTVGSRATLGLSVICPFYNESQILAVALRGLLDKLQELTVDWELIVVNDGSKDESLELARNAAANEPRLRVLSYDRNRGRGHALRTGIGQARGEIIVTTEIDLSWGEDIVERLNKAILADPAIDIVIASPHLPGGGYRNVPWKRVFFSRFGNRVIRTLMTNAASMNTGMTRAYRRHCIRSLPLEEDGKEFHLEVVLKAQALNYRFSEIPALLEWKEYKLKDRKVERKSSSKVNKLVLSHSLFSLFGNPTRYVWALSAISLFLSIGFLVAAIWRLFAGQVSVYMVIISLAMAIIAMMFFAFGVIAQQANMIQKEIWTLKQGLRGLLRDRSAEESSNIDDMERSQGE